MGLSGLHMAGSSATRNGDRPPLTPPRKNGEGKLDPKICAYVTPNHVIVGSLGPASGGRKLRRLRRRIISLGSPWPWDLLGCLREPWEE